MYGEMVGMLLTGIKSGIDEPQRVTAAGENMTVDVMENGWASVT